MKLVVDGERETVRARAERETVRARVEHETVRARAERGSEAISNCLFDYLKLSIKY